MRINFIFIHRNSRSTLIVRREDNNYKLYEHANDVIEKKPGILDTANRITEKVDKELKG